MQEDAPLLDHAPSKEPEDLVVTAERVRQLEVMNALALGVMLASSWCTVIVEQASGWGRVGLLCASVVVMTAVLPSVVCAIVQSLTAWTSNRASFKREGARKLQRLSTDAAAACWAATAVTCVATCLDDSVTFRRYWVDAVVVAALCVAVAAGSCCLSVLALSRLADETRPFHVEVWLLLVQGPHLVAGYAILAVLDVIRLGRAARLGISLAVAALAFFVARDVFRRAHPPTSASDMNVLTYNFTGLVAALAVRSVVRLALDDLVVWARVLVYGALAISLFGNAMARPRHRLVYLEHPIKRTSGSPLATVAHDLEKHRDEPFYDVYERWLAAAAVWALFDDVLRVLLHAAAISPSGSHSLVGVLVPFGCFAAHITLAFALTLLFMLPFSTLVLHTEVYRRRQLLLAAVASTSLV